MAWKIVKKNEIRKTEFAFKKRKTDGPSYSQMRLCVGT